MSFLTTGMTSPVVHPLDTAISALDLVQINEVPGQSIGAARAQNVLPAALALLRRAA